MKAIYLLRHGERQDRATEYEGLDWISTAPRPQDPPLSKKGIQQVQFCGKLLKDRGITRILCSPMIRTVQSADFVAEQLGFGEKSLCMEWGLLEQARSMRGYDAGEPLPVWTPLVQSPQDATAYSSRINMEYSSLRDVKHKLYESMANAVAEIHDDLPILPDKNSRDAITKSRCEELVTRILDCDALADDIVICVCHGATIAHMTFALQNKLEEDDRIKGDAVVSCFAGFVPTTTDDAKVQGSWKSLVLEWETGDATIDASKENADDAGR